MGLICSCLSADDFDEYTTSDGSIYRQCICLRCFTQPMIHAYTSIFRRGEVRAAPSSVQETTPLASATLVDGNSLSYSYRSPPRPLPYDDPRCSRIEQDGPVSRRDKSSSHLHEESEPITTVTDIESNSRTEKLCGSKLGGRSKLCYTESSLKHPLEEVSSGVTCIFSSSEDEDVCPTCLDEYSSENPRIVMQCSHHFHLSCIYEWMERSEACPVCGKHISADSCGSSHRHTPNVLL